MEMRGWKAKRSIVFLLIALIPSFAYAEGVPTPKKPSQEEGHAEKGKVFSLESLDKAETYEDLEKWGLVAPGQYNHKSGKNLILLALKSTSLSKGDWAATYGMLGTNMIDVEFSDRLGYKALFQSVFIKNGYKMYASSVINDLFLIADSSKKGKSIIARREAAIFLVSRELELRYVYNDSGSFSKNYSPEPNRRNNKQLKKEVLSGIKVYQEFLKMGFNDKTLKDTLCMAAASLHYDVGLPDIDLFTIGPVQVCLDALKATLEILGKKKDHNFNLLQELGVQMQIRELASDDRILVPIREEGKNFEAILKIIENDLDLIKK